MPSVSDRYPIGDIENLWTKRDSDRTASLDRARDCAMLTMPHLLPPRNWTELDYLPTPWQAHGARCIRNLAGRLAVTLIPPNMPFFKYGVLEFIVQMDEELRTKWPELRPALRSIESSVTTFFDTHGWRVPVVHAFEYLVAVGGALLHIDKDDRMRCIRRDKYVVKRDNMGTVYEITVKEPRVFKTLPRALQDLVRQKAAGLPDTRCPEDDKVIDVFTHVCREDNKMVQTQEVCGVLWDGGAGSWPEEACPWIPLRFSAIDGDSDGRGLVEQTLGDWRSLEAHYISINEVSAIMSKIVPLVNPAGMTNIRDLVKGLSGVPLPGRADDVSFVQANKVSDAQFMLNTVQEITQRLSYIFLLNSSVQRQGERVTAEEIRLLAQELEYSFGGTYALLAEELQLKLAKFIIKRLEKEPGFPKLDDALKPQIVTGVSALGRSSEASALDRHLSRAQLNPAFASVIDAKRVMEKSADIEGLPEYDILKSDQQIQDEQAHAEEMAMAQQVAPEVAKAQFNQQQQGGNIPNGQTQ